MAKQEYYHSRDAEDAVRDMDRRTLNGSRIIVEFAGQRRDQRRGPNSRDTCYNCGKVGHWANECKEGDWRDKCYRCGSKGHMRKDCKASRSVSRSRSRSRSRSPVSRSQGSKSPRKSSVSPRDNSPRRSRMESPSSENYSLGVFSHLFHSNNMSANHLALPFLMLNLGGEMVYILNQRLVAQKIPKDKADKVREDVVKHILDPSFVEDLMKPQPLYSMTSTRQVFDKLAHSSIMKLQKSSMDKLFELMLMGVKFQMLSVKYPEEILQVTYNHLKNLREMVRASSAEENVNSVFTQLRNKYEQLKPAQFNSIRQALMRFFQDRNVKVSLFLTNGIQLHDSSIVIDITGQGPPGTQIPGTVLSYSTSGSISKTTQVQLISSSTFILNTNSQRIVEGSTYLGNDLYREDIRPPVEAQQPRSELKQQPPQVAKSPEWQPKYAYVADENRKKVAKWELDSLASMIAPVEEADNRSVHLSIFAEPMETERVAYPSLNVVHVEGQVRNLEIERLMQSLEVEESKSSKKHNEEDELLDMLDG